RLAHLKTAWRETAPGGFAQALLLPAGTRLSPYRTVAPTPRRITAPWMTPPPTSPASQPSPRAPPPAPPVPPSPSPPLPSLPAPSLSACAWARVPLVPRPPPRSRPSLLLPHFSGAGPPSPRVLAGAWV